MEIRADMMIPYHHTKAWGQVPCEDVTVRIPIPEAWVYQFRNEKLDVTMGKVRKVFTLLLIQCSQQHTTQAASVFLDGVPLHLREAIKFSG